MITQATLKELLHYNPDTGVFTWLERPERYFKTVRTGTAWNDRYAGRVAGAHCPQGRTVYRQIEISGAKHYAHRLACLYVHGKLPDNQIDHIDGNGSNNWITNLRDVTHAENQKNKQIFSNNTSGCTGVGWDRRESMWHAQISISGKNKHLGYFTGVENAIAARKSAEIEFGFHENHGR